MTRVGTTLTAVALVFVVSVRGTGQAPDPQTAAAAAALAKATFEATASTLALYDRQGRLVRTIGDRALYSTPVLSPDGARVAVAKRDPSTENTDIWVIDLATGVSTPITSDPAVDNWPVWSPDGREIAFHSNREGGRSLRRANADGTGPAEVLFRPTANLFTTDWSTDGRLLTFYDQTSLHILSIAPRADRTVAEVLGVPIAGRAGRFSPDGRFIAYVSDQSGRPEIWVRPVASAAGDGTGATGPWQISDQGGVGMVFWHKDATALYYLAADRTVMEVEVSTAPRFTVGRRTRLFTAPDRVSAATSGTSVSRDGQSFLFNVLPPPRGTRFPRQTTVFDRQGNVVRTIGEPVAGFTEPSLSPDGTHVALTRDERIQVVNLSTGASVPVTAPSSAVRYVGAPVWSRDGRELVSFSQREAWSGFYRRPSDGSGTDELVYREEFEICYPVTDWSPDGRFLAFGGGGVLWTVPVNGERPASEFLREEFRTLGLRFSPDSRYVAYASDESDRYEVYVRPFDTTTGSAGKEKWQVSTDGGLNLIQWREDGRELIYLTRDGTVMTVDIETSPTFRAGLPKPLFQTPPSVRALVASAPTIGDPTACGERGAGCGVDQLGNISRDGQRFVFDVPVHPPFVSVARDTLTRYVGTWRQPAGGTRLMGNLAVLTLEEGALMLEADRPKAPLHATSATTFRGMRGAEYEFAADATGNLNYLFVYEGGAPALLVRE